MPNIRLELPNIKYYESFMKAIKEFQEYGYKKTDSDTKYDKFSLNMTREEFAQIIVKTYLDISMGVNLPDEFVPGTDYWIIDEDGYAGRMNLRHKLNDNLMKVGGHIGYDVVPSKRNKGYASKALRLALEEANKKGTDKALITCRASNIASKKTILGVLGEYGGTQDESYVLEDGEELLRFWVNTKK